MKKAILIAGFLCVIVTLHAGIVDTILFSDNFDRPDNTDIDASSTGMSGTLSPLVYQESFEGSGLPTSIQILTNQLNAARGTGMSCLFLDHNFTDSAILDADGFSVSLEIVSIATSNDPANRFGGFGVGNTRSEAESARDAQTTNYPFRPITSRANQGFGVSDFYVDLALDGTLKVWSNGDLLNTIDVGATEGTIAVDFIVTDFNAGSPVTAVVYFNGIMHDVQNFTWDNTGENYLGISARTTGDGVMMDNLEITAIYNERAHDPLPDGTSLVPAGAVNLQWTKGNDAQGNPNQDITKHYLYITEELFDGEPNFLASTAEYYEVPDTADPVTKQISVINDKTKYWRVDESVLIDGNPSGADDPNTIQGVVWQFETERSIPIIQEDGDPADVIRFAYNDPDHNYEGDAVFTCSFTSIHPVTIEWYRASDPETPVDNSDPDITIDPGQNETSYECTLTIANVEKSDEDAYYCRIELLSDPENPVVSESANLGVRRKVAHWTMNYSDLVNGQYQDISGENHHADPNIIPDKTLFDIGADSADKGSLNLGTEPLAAADSGIWNPALYTGEMTISVWANWAGLNGLNQILVAGRNNETSVNSWFLEIIGGRLQANAPGYNPFGSPVPYSNEWMHVAFITSDDGGTIYVNGMEFASAENYAMNIVEVPVYLGCAGRFNGVLGNAFNGLLDDVQIYNYAMTNAQVIDDLYYAFSGKTACLNADDLNLQFDVAGGGVDGDEPDCRVNLLDFAAFAQTWLNCGRYPEETCR